MFIGSWCELLCRRSLEKERWRSSFGLRLKNQALRGDAEVMVRIKFSQGE